MRAMVPGVYKQGKIELLETPRGLREGRVRVILITVSLLTCDSNIVSSGLVPIVW